MEASCPLQCPVTQRTRTKIVHFESSDDCPERRADSGIVEVESDFESSGTSSVQSSSSLDSSICSGKFPALTEVYIHPPCDSESRTKHLPDCESSCENLKCSCDKHNSLQVSVAESSGSEKTPPSPVKVQMGVIFSVN